jgi:hypothetical protein
MLSSFYVEDIFLEFYHIADIKSLPIQRTDLAPISSFFITLSNGNQLTENQGKFILKILEKYKNLAAAANFDYTSLLENPKWKMPFRVMDYSKKIFVNSDESGNLWICMKFPYQLKKAVDDEICGGSSGFLGSVWDAENKVRKFSVNESNVVQINEFVLKNGFEIDDSFLALLADIEEIWQNQEKITPRSDIVDDTVVLINSTNDAQQYWDTHRSGNLADDILLAKSMGFRLLKSPTNTLEKIGNSTSNSFWIKTNLEFLSICRSISGKVCVVLDRVGRTQEWLEKFAADVERAGIPRSEVKVCFRANKEEDPELNQWIKDQGFGGKVEDGRILIFNHKPAKWLFKETESVKILASNNLYPSTNQLSRDWFNSHPCVIYVGDIKPSQSKEQKIVNL